MRSLPPSASRRRPTDIRTDMDKTLRHKDMGLIRASYEVFRDEGELVLSCEYLQTVKYRNPGDFVAKTEK